MFVKRKKTLKPRIVLYQVIVNKKEEHMPTKKSSLSSKRMMCEKSIAKERFVLILFLFFKTFPSLSARAGIIWYTSFML